MSDITITGAYNSAVCFTDYVEDMAAEQIRAICDRPEFRDSQIRIMPDVHAGTGCTIGTTMTIQDQIIPSLVGVDIGCGMETTELVERDIPLAELDRCIREHIPSGRQVRSEPHALCEEIDLEALRCVRSVQVDYARHSLGSLGGGNHFIEIDKSRDGRLFLIIHSGSRYLGGEVAQYYQRQGYKALVDEPLQAMHREIARLKEQKRFTEIQPMVERFRAEEHEKPSITPTMACVKGQLLEDYLHDMKLVQRFAVLNRQAMTQEIVQHMGLTVASQFTTIHNYIDTEARILRKGAVSAKQGEKLLIPINMRDGALICIGKGNPDWNYSAPHGAGRLMSRGRAFQELSMDEYEREMRGIFSHSVVQATLDESPMAYKSLAHILGHIGPTVDVVERITPIYNFKAAE